MKTVLTIAGSDSIGGAGIQADIKTITMNGAYAMSAVTALTAQNTRGVTEILEAPPEFVEEQIDAVFKDIKPDAIKTGMVGSEDIICAVANQLKARRVKNLVVDPVMVSTSGAKLMPKKAIAVLKEQLIPLATLVTPNIPEAEVISGIKIFSYNDLVKSAKAIAKKCGCPVLIKGGHRIEGADDILFVDGKIIKFTGERIDNPNTHGTGCTLSAAIATNLAKGFDLVSAVEWAKDYVTNAIAANLNLGKGNGPIQHSFDLDSVYACDWRGYKKMKGIK